MPTARNLTRVVFIGHDFFGDDSARKSLYRDKVLEGIADANSHAIIVAKRITYHPIYGDTAKSDDTVLARRLQNRPTSTYYWTRIRDRIRVSDAAIFDLASRKKNTLNLNVLLELGVAYGEKSSPFVLCTNRKLVTDHLSNLWGNEIGQYNDTKNFSDLASEIRKILLLNAEL